MVRPKVIDAKSNQNNQGSSFVKTDRFVDAERLVSDHKNGQIKMAVRGNKSEMRNLKQNKLRRKLCFVVSRHAILEIMRELSQETDIPI